MDAENNSTLEVAPQASEAQSTQVDTTAEVSSSPETGEAGGNELILGKFKSTDDLIKSYSELESSWSKKLNDPDFIYERAQKLGLANEETSEEPMFNPTQAGESRSTYEEYQYFRSIEKAQDKYPELKKDEELQLMVTALINKGMNPEKAADKVFAKINRQIEEAKKEGAAQKAAEISEKEKAQLATSTSNVNSDSAEMEQLLRESKSLDRRTQERAKLEILKRRMK